MHCSGTECRRIEAGEGQQLDHRIVGTERNPERSMLHAHLGPERGPRAGQGGAQVQRAASAKCASECPRHREVTRDGQPVAKVQRRVHGQRNPRRRRDCGPQLQPEWQPYNAVRI